MAKRKFPREVPIRRLLKILKSLGFDVVRIGNHISLMKENEDGSRTPMTIPNHKKVDGKLVLHILAESGITREEFLKLLQK
jgi:predicted RNA binding protein YcfA (HicA-like mRNA interferase family)